MRNRILVPIGLVTILLLSYYMLYAERTAVEKEYRAYIEAARSYVEQGIIVDAIKNYRDALDVSDTLELNLEVGEVLVNAKEMGAAINWGEDVIDKYPNEPGAYAFLLSVYKSNTDYEDFFELYEIVTKKELVNEEIKTIVDDIRYAYYLDDDFEDVGTFSYGYCPAMRNGKWGMVSETGSRAFGYDFAYVGEFMSDIVPVQSLEGEYFFVDAEGNKKIVLQDMGKVVEVTPMLNDIFAIYDGLKWTYYTSNKEKLSEGYDSVSVPGNMVAAVEDNGKYYLIDTENNRINDKDFQNVMKDDRGIVYRNEVLFAMTDNYYYMINKEGEPITETKYINAKVFNDTTYAAVETGKGWVFIDNQGNEVFENKVFQDAHSFLNGFAAVKMNGKWGFIDQNGEIAIDCIFDEVKDFTTKGTVFVKQYDTWEFLKLYSYGN